MNRTTAASTNYALAIYGEGGGLMVAIRRRDGGIEYGPGFTSEQEAARTFWKAMGEELWRWAALPGAGEEQIVQHIARAIHADEHQRRFIGAWDALAAEMKQHYERVGRLRLESVRAAERGGLSDEEMPTDREWTDLEWARNQLRMANERITELEAQPVVSVEAVRAALDEHDAWIPDEGRRDGLAHSIAARLSAPSRPSETESPALREFFSAAGQS